MKVNRMTISLICAVSKNNIIGKNNALPWHISDDLKFFKETTLNQTVILGRKNYESIGRPLHKRQNIILTRDPNYKAEGCLVVNSVREALNKAEHNVFIIGGAEIYKAFLPYATVFYRTTVLAEVEGDVFFPEYNVKEWKKEFWAEGKKSENNDYDFLIEKLTRSKQVEMF